MIPPKKGKSQFLMAGAAMLGALSGAAQPMPFQPAPIEPVLSRDVAKLPPEFTPTLIEDGAIEAGFPAHLLARLFGRAFGRPG